MMNADQVHDLLNKMGLTTTITRNGIELDTVKAVIINGKIVTRYPIEVGDILTVHNKNHKVLSVTSVADNLYFDGTYDDYA